METWVCLPRGMSQGRSPRDIPRERQTQVSQPLVEGISFLSILSYPLISSQSGRLWSYLSHGTGMFIPMYAVATWWKNSFEPLKNLSAKIKSMRHYPNHCICCNCFQIFEKANWFAMGRSFWRENQRISAANGINLSQVFEEWRPKIRLGYFWSISFARNAIFFIM